MKRLFVTFIIMITVLIGACKKDQQALDTVLTGTWVRGASAGDTLYFTRNNDKNILRYNASFNPTLPVVTDIEYGYVGGKLLLKKFGASQSDFYIIESFTWVQGQKEFEVVGNEIFPFMSSMTRFTYRKIN